MVARRTKIGKSYVRRRADGTFIKFTGIGKSLSADRRVKARTVVPSGQGHRGDQKVRVKKRLF